MERMTSKEGSDKLDTKDVVDTAVEDCERFRWKKISASMPSTLQTTTTDGHMDMVFLTIMAVTRVWN